MVLQTLKKIKPWLAENKSDLFIAFSFFLIAIIGFGLGRLSVSFEEPKEAIRVEHTALPALAGTGSIQTEGTRFVGSKNGSVYHLPHCSGAARIKEENKIWFSSKEEAESLGYTPAKNCNNL